MFLLELTSDSRNLVFTTSDRTSDRMSGTEILLFTTSDTTSDGKTYVFWYGCEGGPPLPATLHGCQQEPDLDARCSQLGEVPSAARPHWRPGSRASGLRSLLPGMGTALCQIQAKFRPRLIQTGAKLARICMNMVFVIGCHTHRRSSHTHRQSSQC